MADQAPKLKAWQPGVQGVLEVLHAHFPQHAYPMHAHESWTLMLLDAGIVRYHLGRHEHGVLTSMVTLLPPSVPHDGRAAGPGGFRKRVIYLDETQFSPGLVDAALRTPSLDDPLLHRRVHQLNVALGRRTEDLEAASRLALIRERLEKALSGEAPPTEHRAGLAHDLRDLLDAAVVEGVTLEAAAQTLHSHPTHLVRAFTREFGMPPHQYLTGLRVEKARHLLLAGEPPARAAVLAGFYDQSHLARHFRKLLGTTPGRFADRRNGATAVPPEVSVNNEHGLLTRKTQE
ncbi:AraC family transcriptional regulator [Kineosporia rhizophila]|uniref:helix-turn-helix transcriptional regulator n=1 Tax=Kineosporia TaxID=49184 RepID=UPI001E305F8B|nr:MULTISPECIES: AraC family transcriptional regulator [Kineosporia]MCE0535961.1 AraC family transcriptional regulator [Kineosporia rhizophila]GLY14209.1 AraC family transcriptional regulator [Kineosporia sp. NBRC 101677]